jgi:hypothetical protein
MAKNNRKRPNRQPSLEFLMADEPFNRIRQDGRTIDVVLVGEEIEYTGRSLPAGKYILVRPMGQQLEKFVHESLLIGAV